MFPQLPYFDLLLEFYFSICQSHICACNSGWVCEWNARLCMHAYQYEGARALPVCVTYMHLHSWMHVSTNVCVSVCMWCAAVGECVKTRTRVWVLASTCVCDSQVTSSVSRVSVHRLALKKRGAGVGWRGVRWGWVGWLRVELVQCCVVLCCVV